MKKIYRFEWCAGLCLLILPLGLLILPLSLRSGYSQNERVAQHYMNKLQLEEVTEHSIGNHRDEIYQSIGKQNDERQTEFLKYYQVVYKNQSLYPTYLTGVVRKSGHKWEGKKVLVILADHKVNVNNAKAAVFELDERYDTSKYAWIPRIGDDNTFEDEEPDPGEQQINFGCLFPVKGLLAAYHISEKDMDNVSVLPTAT
jgi:hypothetical protein